MAGAIIIAFIVVCIAFGVVRAIANDKAIAAAKRGAVRVETVKAAVVNRKIQEYARKGWDCTSQSSAKSFGRTTQVSLTFVKR